jgi:hypothetical protein
LGGFDGASAANAGRRIIDEHRAKTTIRNIERAIPVILFCSLRGPWSVLQADPPSA